MWINTSGTQYINVGHIWWMTLEPPRRNARLLGFSGGTLTDIGTVESRNYEKACSLSETLLKITDLRPQLEKIDFINIDCFAKVEFLPDGKANSGEDHFVAVILTAPDGGTLRIDDPDQVRIIKAYSVQGKPRGK